LDYRTQWTFEEQAALLKAQDDIYQQGFEAEPVIENK
jgi:hypothetical protein